MRLPEVGEFGLIDRLDRVLGNDARPRVLIGIGDDAAAWLPTPGTITVATTDALVAGVHFDMATTGWGDLGWKALAENVSDIAAMGCRPRYALVAMGLPAEQLVADVEELYRGMAECAKTYDCVVVGGDVVRAPLVVLQVTLMGESLLTTLDTHARPLLERSRASVGDAVAVTGPLGGSAAGLRLLAGAASTTSDLAAAAEMLIRLHRRPLPRVGAGLALVEAGVRCAIDVSDGLVADVGHICERSGVDVEIDAARVPIPTDAVRCFKESSLDLALSGGEDYELVCTAPPGILARASDLLITRGEPPLTLIGSVAARSGASPSVRVRTRDGALYSVAQGGYRHFDA